MSANAEDTAGNGSIVSTLNTSKPPVSTGSGQELTTKDVDVAAVADVNGAGDHKPYVSPFTPEEERRIMRKVDIALVPWLSFLYLLSFLDRSAIGNAKLYRMEESLGIDPRSNQFNLALTLFFIPYALFEIPSNVLLKRLRPSIWFPIITMLVGVSMLSQGVVKDLGGLITARIFLGVTEAGLFPGVNYLMASWYKRSEFGIRASVFFSAASIAGAFGGLLAAGLSNITAGGYEGWRWIFIVIGLITFVAGVITFFVIPDFPDNSKFLTEEERAFVIGRLSNDQQFSAKGETFSWLNVAKGFVDWKTWIGALIYAGCDGPLYAFSLFTPTITKTLFTGASATQANLLSVPIYVFACLQVLAIGFICARYGHRALANIIMMVIGAAGYIMLLASKSHPLSYVAVYIAAFGIYACIPNTIALTSQAEPNYKRSAIMAFIISFGNLNGAVTSGAIYRSSDAPNYRLGHGIVLLYICIGVITSALFWWGISRENRIRDSGARDEHILDPSIPLQEREQLAAEAQAKRLQEIRQRKTWLPFYKQFLLLQAHTHSLPGGTYVSVQDAQRKKGDDWSGYRYKT